MSYLKHTFNALVISSSLLLASCWEQRITPLKTLEVASHGIHAGRLSNNSEYAVIGSIFHGISLWRLDDGERLYNWSHNTNINGDDDARNISEESIITSADIDNNNRYALTTDASNIILWQMNSGQSHRLWASPAEVLDSRLHENGRYAILGLTDHSAVIFDIIRGGLVRTFRHQGRVRSIDIAANVAASGSEDHTAIVWSLQHNEPLFKVQHEDDVQLVRLSADGRYLLTAAKYDRAEIWDVQKREKIGILPLKKEQIKRGLRITAAAFDSNDQHLLIGFANRTVELRDVKTLELIKTWHIPKRKPWQPASPSIIDVAFDASNEAFWVMSSDGMLYLIN